MPIARAESPPTLAAHLDRPRFSVHGCWAYARQMFSLFCFFAIGLVVSPLCTLTVALFGRWIPHTAGQDLIQSLFAFWLKYSSRLGVFDIQFPEAEKIQGLRGTIIAPNHPTVMDAVILLSLVPRTVCIMRASLVKNPCLGGAALMAGYVTNDSGPALIRQGVERIQNGANLLIFPEGTRTREDAVNSFKNGFALIAAKSGAPIQTIFIERDCRYLGKGVSFFAPTTLPIRYRLHVGETVQPEKDETASAFALRLEEYFQARLENTGRAIRLRESDF